MTDEQVKKIMDILVTFKTVVDCETFNEVEKELRSLEL